MNQQILWALAGQTGLIVAGVVVVVIFNNSRFAALDKRFDDLRSEMNARFNAVDNRFEDLKDWIHSEVRRLDDRIERMEHPVVRQ